MESRSSDYIAARSESNEKAPTRWGRNLEGACAGLPPDTFILAVARLRDCGKRETGPVLAAKASAA
jgi:hypothetical protein